MDDRPTRRTVLATAGAAAAAMATTATLLTRPLATAAAEAAADADDKAAAYPIGCYTRPWDQHEVAVALDAIAEAGFKRCGLMTQKGRTLITPFTKVNDAGKLGEQARRRGLIVESVYGDFRVEGTDAVGVGRAVAMLQSLVDNVGATGASSLLLGGVTDARLYDAYFKAVAECCAYAEERNVLLTIKPHGGQNATGPQCRKAIEKVGHRNFRLWYDPGNIFYYSDGKLDPAEDAATVNGLVAGMCVKDFLPPKEVMVTPGTGKVDFPKVLATLRKGGFTAGPLIVECLTRGDGKDAAKITAEAAKARKFLEDLVARL